MARKEHKRESREEREVDEDSGERRITSQIAHEVVAGIKEKASVHDGITEAVQRPAGQSFMRSWDCQQIESEEEEESWREGDQMAAKWDQEQKLEGIFRTKKDGKKLLAIGGGPKEKKRVPGWSAAEMMEKTKY